MSIHGLDAFWYHLALQLGFAANAKSDPFAAGFSELRMFVGEVSLQKCQFALSSMLHFVHFVYRYGFLIHVMSDTKKLLHD